MGQFSIKNDHAVDLLEHLARLTGQGKTETIVRALELYQAQLLAERDTAAVLASIRETVHPHLAPEHRGRAPGKAEIEADLGMP